MFTYMKKKKGMKTPNPITGLVGKDLVKPNHQQFPIYDVHKKAEIGILGYNEEKLV